MLIGTKSSEFPWLKIVPVINAHDKKMKLILSMQKKIENHKFL